MSLAPSLALSRSPPLSSSLPFQNERRIGGKCIHTQISNTSSSECVGLLLCDSFKLIIPKRMNRPTRAIRFLSRENTHTRARIRKSIHARDFHRNVSKRSTPVNQFLDLSPLPLSRHSSFVNGWITVTLNLSRFCCITSWICLCDRQWSVRDGKLKVFFNYIHKCAVSNWPLNWYRIT